MPRRPLDVLRSTAYLLASFPLGVAYVTFLALAVVAGAALLLLVVGMFVLAGAAAIARRVAVADARLAARLFETRPPELAHPAGSGSLFGVALGELTCADSYRAGLYLLVRFCVGVVGFVVVVTWLALATVLVGAPLYYDRADVTVGLSGVWEASTLPDALALAVLGLVVAVLGAAVVASAGRTAARASALVLTFPDRS